MDIKKGFFVVSMVLSIENRPFFHDLQVYHLCYHIKQQDSYQLRKSVKKHYTFEELFLYFKRINIIDAQ